MMKEIKYRYWSFKLKKMIPWEDISINFQNLELLTCTEPDKPKHFHLSDTIEQLSKEGVFMQYIGRPDVNGVDLYEGDIVKTEYQTEFGATELLGEIYFNRKLQAFGAEGKAKFTIPKYIEQPKAPLIVGNIFENPELLKDEKNK